MMEVDNSIPCELGESRVEDYGLRVVRIPPNALEKLSIPSGDIVDIVSRNKRITVVALASEASEVDIESLLQDLQELNLKVSGAKKEDKGKGQHIDEALLPRPFGLPFVPKADSVYIARLDGEVRVSLGCNIGDIVKIQRSGTPHEAKHVFISLLGHDPQEVSDEEKQMVFATLLNQGRRPLSSGLQIEVTVGFKIFRVLIHSTDPEGAVIASKKTILELNDFFIPGTIFKVSYNQLGGMENVISRLRKLVEIPIRKPQTLREVNISPPRGILLSGPTGSGKSLLISALINESGARVIEIPPNLYAGIGPTEKNIRNLFQTVRNESETKPVILLLDNLELLAPSPYVNQPEYERRFAMQFALAMDGLSQSKAIVIGTCHSADRVAPFLRRAGRFEIEIELAVPTERDRLEIFKIHLRTVPLGKNVEQLYIAELSRRMVGFVGGDIASFVKMASMHAVSRHSDVFLNYEQIPKSVLRSIRVLPEDFEHALKFVEPSGLRSINSKVEIPKTRWADVGGMEPVKQLLREQVEWQFKHPQALREIGIKPAGGLLLYGPPGNGKTLLARAIATEIQVNFISLKGPELLSMWFGESAKMIRDLFVWAQRLAPTIVFFDEIDAMAPRRGSDTTDAGREVDATVNQLLTLMDGVEGRQGVVIIGATNRPWALDRALLRPGRLDKLVLVPSPDVAGRKEILAIHMRSFEIEDKIALIDELSQKTNGFSGADLENICREAVFGAIRDMSNHVTKKHFELALGVVNPSVSSELVEYYRDFATDLISQP
ncbi:MAG TPA: AAA family ATPase, partial [Candidatus Hodarchaeales archaeon]|nr:AAA family ATPase [Candidatus Hodarchaeales archaeon]